MRKLNVVRRLSVMWLVFLSALPYVQRQTRVFPVVRLHGVETRSEKPAFTGESWFAGKYASAWERRLAQKIGFRGLCVKSLNQLNYALFRTIPEGGTRIVVGQGGWLYEAPYIDDILAPRPIPPENRRRFTSRLVRLQDALGAQHKTFALILSPTKARTYPAFLPENVQGALQGEPPNDDDYDALVAGLRSAGVLVIDGQAVFSDWARRDGNLFPPGGTHWSYYGSYLFADYLLNILSESRPSGDLNVARRLVRTDIRAPLGTDTDLYELLNMFSFGAGVGHMPYPVVETAPLPIENRPNLLMVGDSFSLTLIDSFNLLRAFGKKRLLFYNSRIFDHPAGDCDGYEMPHDECERAWQQSKRADRRLFLEQSDVILLCINRVHLRHYGWRFVEQALEILTTDSGGSGAEVRGSANPKGMDREGCAPGVF